MCKKEIFQKMKIVDCSLFVDKKHFNHHRLCNKYNIMEEKHLVTLFYLLFYDYEKIPSKNDSQFHLVISLYNETDLSRSLELLLSLLNNMENENIHQIHILYEMNSQPSIVDELVKFMKENVSFINLVFIEERPSFDFCFQYCDENIKGKVILSNSDIIYDQTLEKINL